MVGVVPSLVQQRRKRNVVVRIMIRRIDFILFYESVAGALRAPCAEEASKRVKPDTGKSAHGTCVQTRCDETRLSQ